MFRCLYCKIISMECRCWCHSKKFKNNFKYLKLIIKLKDIKIFVYKIMSIFFKYDKMYQNIYKYNKVLLSINNRLSYTMLNNYCVAISLDSVYHDVLLYFSI